MREKKDLRLVNIYIRIHNKQALTIDDLAYLAKYNPVCFKKTCDNLIYKVPEANKLVKASEKAPKNTREPKRQLGIPTRTRHAFFEISSEEIMQNKQVIVQMIDNLKNIESGEAENLQSIDLDQVKGLLGNMFMENLFPHEGIQGYFDVAQPDPGYTFDARV